MIDDCRIGAGLSKDTEYSPTRVVVCSVAVVVTVVTAISSCAYWFVVVQRQSKRGLHKIKKPEPADLGSSKTMPAQQMASVVYVRSEEFMNDAAPPFLANCRIGGGKPHSGMA